jgi:hypothetical protein
MRGAWLAALPFTTRELSNLNELLILVVNASFLEHASPIIGR